MATESGTQRRYLGRLVTHRNGDLTLFLPFVFLDDPDSDRSFAVLQGVSNLDALFGDFESKAGLPPASKASIEALPEVEIGEQEDSVTDCAICLDGMKVAKVMPCKHMFHGGCVEKWLKIHGSCPVCRFQMPAEEERGSRKGRANEGADDSGTRRHIWIPFSVTSVSAADQSSNQEMEQQQQQQQQSSD